MGSKNEPPFIVIKGIVLLISLNFPPEMSGGATGAWNRAMVLQNLGFKVYILAGMPSLFNKEVNNVKYQRKFFFVETVDHFTIIRIKVPQLANSGFFQPFLVFVSFVLLSTIYLPKIWKITSRVDIVYARSPIVFCSILGYIYSRLMRSYYIYEAPDIWPDELVVIKSPLLPLVLSVGKIFAKLSYYSPNIILTISEAASDYIKKEYKPKPKVFGIPSGVDSRRFSPLPIEGSRAQLIDIGIYSQELMDKFIVLYSGRLSDAQRVEDLAYAAERLKGYPDIRIVIIGEGPSKNKLIQLKKQKNLVNLVILHPQKRELMPMIISSANVCTLFLSNEPIYDIAIPTKFYEYLGCQKPLIGVCGGEVEKIIRNNNIGFTCRSGEIDKLASAILNLRDIKDLSLLKTNSLMALREFSLESISKKFMNILEQNCSFYHGSNSGISGDLV
jgi:glycosyltransferase involved in cell wall biosynthesis